MPVEVPLAPVGSEHVAPHDVGAGRGDRRDLLGVFRLVFEHPCTEAVEVEVSERSLATLALAGGVAVERDHHVCGDLWHFVSSSWSGRN
jgi:hypothetical protein